jgi:hypothetical protein
MTTFSNCIMQNSYDPVQTVVVSGDTSSVQLIPWKINSDNDTILADSLNNATEERIMRLVEKRLKQAEKDQDVIVKCGHCGQWAAIKTPCYKCGAPVG